jgi:hypothetical protein
MSDEHSVNLFGDDDTPVGEVSDAADADEAGDYGQYGLSLGNDED